MLVLADGPNRPVVQQLGGAGLRPRLATAVELEAAIADGSCDLIVIDRGADTASACTAIKDRERNVPVICVVADADARLAALRAGADHCASGAAAEREELAARARWLIESSLMHRAGLSKLSTLRLWHDWVRYLVHDLRNPITIASLAVQAAAAKGDERMQSAERALRSANAMLQDILDTDRFRHGAIALHRETVDIGDLATAVATELGDPGQVVVRSTGSVRLDADPALLRRLLVNLIENALRFAREKPVAVDITGTTLGLSVRVGNDGPGIEPALRPHVFDPWHTLEHDGEPHATGLGLAFCRLVCEAHGGRIWLDSAEPGDVAFAFGLPHGGGTVGKS